MKKEKKSKFNLEKYEVAKLSNLNMKQIVGGLSDVNDDPRTTTGTNDGGKPSGPECGG